MVADAFKPSLYLGLLLGTPAALLDEVIGVDFVHRHPLIERTAFGIIVNACIGAILFAAISFIKNYLKDEDYEK